MSIVERLDINGKLPKYHNITDNDMLNGDGLRVVFWLSGCSHNCYKCQNPLTWNPEDGLDVTEETLQEIISYLDKPWTTGITFSGGDPLYSTNRDFVGKFAKYLKENYPDKDIWLYTGFNLIKRPTECVFSSKAEEFTWNYLKYIDVVVDGPFDNDLRTLDLQNGTQCPWRGSSNQRVIDIQETFRQDFIVSRN